MHIDDLQGHFVTMLGSCWDDARIAGMTMRVELWDGTTHEGVPVSTAHGRLGGELDHTGVAALLQLDGITVASSDVRTYTAVLADEHRPTA